MGFAEIAPDSLLGRTAALMADDCDRAASEVAQAGDDRAVVGEAAIAVKLEKVAQEMLDVVQGLRPRWIAREAHALDGAERGRRGYALCWSRRARERFLADFHDGVKVRKR
jgi:hypothetical protein